MKPFFTTLLIISILSIGSVFSQDNLSLFIQNNPSAMLINPALTPANSFICIPAIGSMGVNVSNSFGLGDISDANSGTYTLSSSKISDMLTKSNSFLAGDYSVDAINIGAPFGESNFIGLSIRTRGIAAGSIGDGVFELLLDNPFNTYKSYDIVADYKYLLWNEIGFTFAHRWNDNWNFGARVKFLSGMATMETSDFNFVAEKHYDKYYISGTQNTNQYDHFDALGGNPGFGFDLGAAYTSNDKHFTGMASISDFGIISWNSYARNIVANNPDAKYEFNGLGELKDDFNALKGSYDNLSDFLTDSLVPEFMQTIGNDTLSESFTSSLPFCIQVGGNYAIDEALSHNVNLAFLGRNISADHYYYAISAGYYWLSPSKHWQLLANYTYYNNSSSGIAIGAVFNAEVVQAFITLDNVSGVFNATNAQHVGMKLGISLRNLLF
ncbi:MAG: DUF5723 family protein [Ignavibacteria bacterium]|jgi:hypothetical protein|nr:DUF5723 family protein [Ignavibacteria bacterium]